jgi:hypothetical protein
LADFDKDASAHPEWPHLPEEALRAFPSVEDILRQKVIPYRQG